MQLSQTKQFFDYAKNKKCLADNTVNSWSAAIAAISAQLAEEEKTIEFVLENKDVIANRLQNSNHEITGQTIQSYIQRACKALEHFQAWQKNRAEWEKSVAAKSPSRASEKDAGAKGKASAKPAEAAQKSTADLGGGMSGQQAKSRLPIPTGDGDMFVVDLPNEYTTSDIVRVAWALAVYASDFDPEQVLSRFGKPPAPARRPQPQGAQELSPYTN